MTEPDRRPPNTPEKEPITALMTCDRLYHGQFEEVMLPATYTDFQMFLGELHAVRGTGGVAEVALQFFMSETPEELAKVDDIHWVALLFDAVFHDEGTELRCRGMRVPKDARDLSAYPDMADVASFSFTWSDVAWSSFDWTVDSHGQKPNID